MRRLSAILIAFALASACSNRTQTKFGDAHVFGEIPPGPTGGGDPGPGDAPNQQGDGAFPSWETEPLDPNIQSAYETWFAHAVVSEYAFVVIADEVMGVKVFGYFPPFANVPVPADDGEYNPEGHVAALMLWTNDEILYHSGMVVASDAGGGRADYYAESAVGFINDAPSSSVTFTCTPSIGARNADGSATFVGCTNGDLLVIEHADLTAASIVNTTFTGEEVLDLEVDGTRLLVMTREGLQVYDVSTLSSPSLQGSVAMAHDKARVLANGNYAYVATGDGNFKVFDVTDQSAMVVVGETTFPGELNQMRWIGTRAVIAAGEEGFLQVDVTVPETPELLALVIDTPGQAQDITIRTQMPRAPMAVDGNAGLLMLDPLAFGL